jgi:hypothetical protein
MKAEEERNIAEAALNLRAENLLKRQERLQEMTYEASKIDERMREAATKAEEERITAEAALNLRFDNQLKYYTDLAQEQQLRRQEKLQDEASKKEERLRKDATNAGEERNNTEAALQLGFDNMMKFCTDLAREQQLR